MLKVEHQEVHPVTHPVEHCGALSVALLIEYGEASLVLRLEV